MRPAGLSYPAFPTSLKMGVFRLSNTFKTTGHDGIGQQSDSNCSLDVVLLVLRLSVAHEEIPCLMLVERGAEALLC